MLNFTAAELTTPVVVDEPDQRTYVHGQPLAPDATATTVAHILMDNSADGAADPDVAAALRSLLDGERFALVGGGAAGLFRMSLKPVEG